MNDFEGLVLSSDPPENDCKGIYWRGRKSTYFSSHGTVEERVSLRVLKSISCPGCEKCGWEEEYIREEISNGMDISHVEDFGVYEFVMHGSNDWETGCYEVDYCEFRRVDDVKI